MKKLVTILIILAIAGGGTYYYYAYGRTPEKPQVVQAAISRGDITEVVSATGTLEALRTVQVGPQVSGTIRDLHGVDYNSIVKKGQVMAELDPTLLQVQVDIQEANIARQQVDIENQKVQLENDKITLQRVQEQFDKQLVSKQALETAQLQVKSRNSQIASAEKMLVQANANLAQAKLNVEYCTVRSPIDGVVVDRRVDVGQTVQSSMNITTFFVVATDLTHLKLTAGVDEADIGKVRPNMDVTFQVDSYPTQTFHGTVNAVRLNATTTNNVVTYPVWIDVPNPDLKLRPSMTAQVKVIVHTVSNVVRVPNQGLRFKPNAEIYAALGLQAPQAGQGRAGRGANAQNGGNANGQGAGAQGATPPAGGAQGGTNPSSASAATNDPAPPPPGASAQPGAPGQNPPADGQSAQNGTGGNRNRNGRGGSGGNGGFGNNGSMSSLTPEQRQAMMERFGRGGGAGGRGGNRGNRTQQPSNVVTGPVTPITERNADKIDELYEAMPSTVSPGQVWTWDEGKKELKQINIRLGITDGQFSELLQGDLQVGQQIVTGVVLPLTQRPQNNNNGNPLMGPQRGNPGGFGGPGGGGGGGGRGGGGGGGGRGGI
jgi:HlyD family secretion protein